MASPQSRLLEDLTHRLADWNLSENQARILYEVFMEAELRGDPSHGFSCLPKVLAGITSGEIEPAKSVCVLTDSEAVAVLDAKGVLGPQAAIEGVHLAMGKAERFGLGAVSLRASQHLFAIGHYARIMANAGFIGLITSNTSPAMAAPGSATKLFGTNPLAFGAPTVSAPLVIDISTSVVARGRIRAAQVAGQSIPATWAVDCDGQPTTDPAAALAGALQPMGGFKGLLVALIVDILSGLLSGSSFAKDVNGTSMHADEEGQPIRHKGDFILAIDITRFMPMAEYLTKMERLSAMVTETEGMRIPGRGERRSWTDVDLNATVRAVLP